MTRPAYFFSEDLQLYASRADLVRRQPMKCPYTDARRYLSIASTRMLLLEVFGRIQEPGEISASLAAQIAYAPQTKIDIAEARKQELLRVVWVTDPDKKDQWVSAPTPKPTSEKAQAGEQPSFPSHGHPFT